MRLFPPNILTSDASQKPPAPQPPSYVLTNRNSEFLYLGTLVNSTVDPETAILSSNRGIKLGVSSSPYQKLGSPDLNSLPHCQKSKLFKAENSFSKLNKWMAPTEEEELRLKELNDESPFKLGPAEKFLMVVLNIPFAFKRVDSLLYIANFDSEIEYLKGSFETLQAACEELRNSRMFLKLLEAVLKTGNRMNVGTNRCDAHAFKLNTLLKLVDVKGTDGKTILLHFVVQETIRAEGSRLSSANQNLKAEKTQQSDFPDDVEFRELGLQVVSGLSGELTNVKKAAAMDSDVLSIDVAKFATGISKIREVIKLNEGIALKDSNLKFSESMNEFLKKAEEEIVRIQAQDRVALSMVKEITGYFHGNSAQEEAHPFRIFTIVRDFLSILDRACKEVAKVSERTVYSLARPLPNPPVFSGFSVRQHYSSSDDETPS
ncbi:Formin-like protein 1 [Hibiscus syriacus]|uniref:Formin-like protein n=1 Tax=Hibiscus syriacus TaxID=106335 RepID=A0A6A3CBY1_HIBSY|nr:Formin-like protein 1 [Hibiscus syriacus]